MPGAFHLLSGGLGFHNRWSAEGDNAIALAATALAAVGIQLIRPPGQHPARRVRMLTEMLIGCFQPPTAPKDGDG